MERPGGPLHGLRVLVVEDNFLAAEALCSLLEVNGCTIVGPAGRVEDGLTLASQEALDGALLDINLAGERCFSIAQALRQRAVPFMFLTGYDDTSLIPRDFQGTHRLRKPITDRALIEAIEAAFASGP